MPATSAGMTVEKPCTLSPVRSRASGNPETECANIGALGPRLRGDERRFAACRYSISAAIFFRI